MVMTCDDAPAGAVEGESELIAGLGLFCDVEGSLLFAGRFEPPVPAEQPMSAAKVISGIKN
jgi:hypothetical protein